MRNFLLAALAGVAIAAPASAQTTTRDIEVIGRALGFMEGVSGSDRVVAIVYDGASEAAAQELAAALDGGLSAGRVTLTGRLVPASEAASISGAHAAVLLGGAAADASVANAVNASGAMSVSTDLSCVESGACVMGVQSAPSVRILVNRGNAEAASVSFAAAFAMMIEEI